jgi:hypothetical protein
MTGMDRTRALLVLACAGGAALLAASQFTNIFELAPPGGEALGEVKSDDQHGYAMVVLGGLSLILLVVSLAARSETLSQGAAFAIAVCGVVALLIFLVIDLPDAGSVGALDDESFIDAKADPVAGFWLELTGAVVLTACGAALATMRPEGVGAGSGGSATAPGGPGAPFHASGDDPSSQSSSTPEPGPQRNLATPSPKAVNREG